MTTIGASDPPARSMKRFTIRSSCMFPPTTTSAPLVGPTSAACSSGAILITKAAARRIEVTLAETMFYVSSSLKVRKSYCKTDIWRIRPSLGLAGHYFQDLSFALLQYSPLPVQCGGIQGGDDRALGQYDGQIDRDPRRPSRPVQQEFKTERNERW